jgi:phospholipase D1/2
MPIDDPTAPVEMPQVQNKLRVRLFACAVMAGIAALWLLTPLRHWLDLAQLVDVLRGWQRHALAPIALLAAFVAGGLVMFPVNLLMAASMVIFGPWLGSLYALLGSLLNAALLYEIGHHASRRLLTRVAGGRLDRLGAVLARGGLFGVALLRIVPVAPYSVVNLVAGAVPIPRRDYLPGTLLGMLPGTVLYALLVDRAVAAIRHPQLANYVWLGAAVLLFALAGAWLARRLLRASRAQGGA